LLAVAPQYEQAKALYADFLRTGIDKDSHWKLRQSEYDIRTAIANYEASINRVSEAAAARVKAATEELVRQGSAEEPIPLARDRLESIRKTVVASRVILPADSDRLRALDSDLARLEALQTAIDKLGLAKRRMNPDLFKGTEAEASAIDRVAERIILKEQPKAEIARVHIVSGEWSIEDITEWSDSTRTAFQHRVTKGVNVQVVALIDDACFLYTLFVHTDTISNVTPATPDGDAEPDPFATTEATASVTTGLAGHVMYRDDFLMENLPK